jgi:hypothetical protein
MVRFDPYFFRGEKSEMKIRKILTLWAVVVFILALAQGCSPEQTPPPLEEESPGAAAEAPSAVEPEEEIDPAAGQGEVEEPTVEQAPVSETGIAEDIPVMEGAYRLQVMRGGSSIMYQVDAEIEEVVTFYQEQLPLKGWEMAGPPDSALPSIASMLRQNAAKDRLTINMQYNPNAGFVTLTIQVARAQ